MIKIIKKMKIGRWVTQIILLLVTVITLYPIVWNIYSSFKTNIEFTANPFALPGGLAWENYLRAIQKASIGQNFLNSIFVVVVMLAVLVVCVIPCSYCLARYKFLGSRAIYTLFMSAIFIQTAYIMIPLYLQMNSLGLRNQLTPLAIVIAATQFPFSIFLLTGYMRAIPKDFEEAAKIDGCGNFRTLLQVIVPLSTPGIITVCMLAAMAGWNEYPISRVLLTDQNIFTLPVGMERLAITMRQATDWGALFAGMVVVLVPTIILYAFGQRYLIQGISAGGIKG